MMGILDSLFGRREVEEFAKLLAADVVKRYPAAIDQDVAKRPSVNRLTRIVEDVCTKAVEFQTEHKLGWMGKARLGNALRWELHELGYRKDFIDLATEAVVIHLSRKA